MLCNRFADMEGVWLMGMMPGDKKCDDPMLMERMWELITDGKSDKEVAEILTSEGNYVGYNTVANYRKSGKLLNFSRKAKEADVKLLDSIDHVTKEFDEVYMEVKKLLANLDPVEHGEEIIKACRLLHDMLATALRKLGFMKNTIIQKNTTINQNTLELNYFLADIGARVAEDGKVVIDKPRPELIEVLKRCEPKKKLLAPVE